jgi:hypothetical protein
MSTRHAGLDFNLVTGASSRTLIHRHLSDTAGVYADQDAAARMFAAGDLAR